MKKLLLLFTATVILHTSHAQFIKRMADRAKNRMEQKAGNKVDKAIDDATDGKKNEKKDKNSSDNSSNNSNDNSNNASTGNSQPSTNDEASNNNETSSSTAAGTPKLEAYSKYDFIPGEKVIAYEDFSKSEIGDFPERWNTNATAEIVTLNNKEGKWIKIVKEGVFHPEFINSLPENFTLEFDLGVNDNWNSWPLAMNIAKLKTPSAFKDYGIYVTWQGDHAVHMDFKPYVTASRASGSSALVTGKDGNHEVNNTVTFTNWKNTGNKFAHISIWRQKQRLRVYLNGDKIWDIPRAFDAAATYNAITFACRGSWAEQNDYYLLSNIRLAIGAPDTRNKLVTEGKFVTSGILFDVNEDIVKPESYGTLKDIAKVLQENGDIRVKIVGHTDADGDDAKNMDLSKRRAAAVKAALHAQFGIDESRMETDGKGESQPVDNNDSVIGKANNRRVEFIKL
jgi:outer membrane protein OmpA-like peptidoglycan-associated protein